MILTMLLSAVTRASIIGFTRSPTCTGGVARRQSLIDVDRSAFLVIAVGIARLGVVFRLVRHSGRSTLSRALVFGH
jgi:hypothetical protein